MSGCLDPWWERANCIGVDPAVFTPQSSGQVRYEEARRYCDSCPVRLDCLNEALELGPETLSYATAGDVGWEMGQGYGMFQAGLTPKELMELRRRTLRGR